MKRLIILIAGIASFYGGCTASIRPVWSVIEALRIEDVSEKTPEYFPVLVKPADEDALFSIGYLNDPTCPPPVVRGLSENSLPRINSDLRTRISTNLFSHEYFTIKKQGEGYIDVRLEVPTIHDSMSKTWYRIQDGNIVPQKRVRYGPGFAFLVIPWVLLSGLLTAFFVMILIRKIWPNHGLESTGAPPAAESPETHP